MGLRRQLTAKVLDSYRDQVCTGDTFSILVDDVTACLPQAVATETVYDSLRHLAGVKLTPALVDQEMWRLAGNLSELVRRRPVPPWSAQRLAEWAPVQITQARRGRNRRGDRGHVFFFRFLAGSACPRVISRFWSDRFCYYLAESLGFSRRRPSDKSESLPRCLMRHPLELVTLLLQVLIEPKLCGAEPGFEKIRVGSSNREWNRQQMRRRDRFDPDCVCPAGHPLGRPCFQCERGYRTCQAAVHPEDYVVGYCGGCAREQALIDSTLSDKLCVDCYEREALKRE